MSGLRRSLPRTSSRVMAATLAVSVLIACVVGWLADPASADNATATAPAAAVYKSGLAPMANDADVPLEWMPPGSRESPVPSEMIFPPQALTIRFNHKKHVQELKLSCKSCHTAAYASEASSDTLLPKPEATCDACHDVDHADRAKVTAGKDENGQCSFCHLGESAGVGGRVARLVIPAPNLRFNHKKHLDRNINCAQCHGKIEELELATRDQLPRMAGCLTCHAMPAASRGDAKGACTTCHLTEPSGKLVQTFATGQLLPPDWLHMAGHGPGWIERHKTVAGADSQFCANCHKEEDCADCHDGKVRNRKVHPNDWLNMHTAAARLDNPRCTSCHQETSFCGDCHRRVGVARDGPVLNRPSGAKFHPPPAEWVNAPRGANHHAWEAQRNLNACVACHSERDCASCHATKGLGGGGGVNPHPLGFESKCKTARSRNPRPCLVCHTEADTSFSRCK